MRDVGAVVADRPGVSSPLGLGVLAAGGDIEETQNRE
jgi:hypothetical protein